MIWYPKLSVSNLVSFESLNGTWHNSFLLDKADMQFPNALIDLLIFLASSSLKPSEPVFESLSEPAKSTMVNNAFLLCLWQLKNILPFWWMLLLLHPLLLILRHYFPSISIPQTFKGLHGTLMMSYSSLLNLSFSVWLRL